MNKGSDEKVFDEKKWRYWCCFGCCHVTVFAKWMSIVLTLFCFRGVFYFINGTMSPTWGILSSGMVASGVFTSLFSIMLYIGIVRQKVGFMIPFPVWITLDSLYCLSLIILLAVELSLSDGRRTQQTKSDAPATTAGFGIFYYDHPAVGMVTISVQIALNVWFIIVGACCVLYFKERYAWYDEHGLTEHLEKQPRTYAPSALPFDWTPTPVRAIKSKKRSPSATSSPTSSATKSSEIEISMDSKTSITNSASKRSAMSV